MIQTQKIKKGKYRLLESGRVVGEISERFVGRYGSASYRWIGACKNKAIHGQTMTQAIQMVEPNFGERT